MTFPQAFEELKRLARTDPALRAQLLQTQSQPDSLVRFCRIATHAGVPLSAIDVIEYGENAYAAMRRSTNGGGENSPMLDGEDDYYDLFLGELQELER